MIDPQQFIQLSRSMQNDLIAFCQRLIRTPSVNGVHDELAIAEVIAEEARRLGLDVQIVGANPRRPNVIVTVGEGEPDLLLIGHLDTVSAGDESKWTYPPFGGETADGKIYGRGAIDTKGGMAAAIYALATFKRVGQAFPLNFSVQFIGVPDEEAGATGILGIKWLHENGLLKGKGAIYCYSGRDILLGHRGLLRWRVTCHGESAHPGFPAWQEGKSGANAVTGMARLLTMLEDTPTPYSSVKYFDKFRMVFTAGTTIEGGSAINIVPDQCSATIDVRLTPDYGAEYAREILDGAIASVSARNPKLRFEVETLNFLPPAISDENAKVMRAAEKALEMVLSVSDSARIVAGPANEGYLLIERGIPTICGFGVMGANAHAADEYVEIETLAETARIFAGIALFMMGSDG